MVFPFYEGINHLGLGIISFSNNLLQQDSHIIEVLVEMSRCIFLEHIRKQGVKQQYNESETKEKEPKSGFFNNFFKKSA